MKKGMSRLAEQKNHGRKVSRRQALKYIGGGTVGLAAVLYGLDRTGRLAFLDKDAKNDNPLQVDRRMFRNIDRPLLGFGCMRLPVLNKEYSKIDTELAEKMIDYAYRRGVNYFDTAYPYHRGLSETFLGTALKKYPRDSYYLADKMPGWLIKSPDDAI
ncbi:aldo/keto reductase [Pectinatus frisingensis]|uniref:aldo/keto reductase n=1 Tax=Pectinatus frisingensis TaxID=865 RepID=UPI0018C54B4F|nr:aldo/keto reductase [Pectinatus frisingensis]